MASPAGYPQVQQPEYQPQAVAYQVAAGEPVYPQNYCCQGLMFFLGFLTGVTFLIGQFLPFCQREPLDSCAFAFWVANIVMGTIMTGGLSLIIWGILFFVMAQDGKKFYV